MQYWFADLDGGVHPVADARAGARPPTAPASTGSARPTTSRRGSPTAQAAQAWVYLGALGQVTTEADRHRRHADRPPLPPGPRRAGVHVARGALPRPRRSSASARARRSTRRRSGWTGRAYDEQRQRLETGPRGDHAAVGRRDRDDGRRLVQAARRRSSGRAPQTRPKLYVVGLRPAVGRRSPARYGDGLWTLGDPEQAPEIVDAYREACAEHGREEGEIIFQAGFAWADDEQAAIDGARHWKPTQLPELYLEDIADQDDMQRRADEQMSDEEFAHEGFLVGADPERARRAHPRDGARRRDRRLPAAHRPRRPARLDPHATASRCCRRCASAGRRVDRRRAGVGRIA